MRLKLAALLLLLVAGGGGAASPAPAPPASRSLDLLASDRILVLAPHPDDEVLGCGGLIQRAVSLHLPIEIAFLTYGDSNEGSFLAYRLHPVVAPSAVEKMGEVRRREALAADAILGVPADRLTFLGYPDAGTLPLWTSHWGARPPGHGLLTRARAVPYSTAFRPGAPYKGEEVLADLEALLRRFRPTRVFVSHPADRHPDHVALYLFTRVALWDLEGQIAPTLHPYLVHFPRWPERGYHPAAPAVAPSSLDTAVAWQSWELTPTEVEVKRKALAAHHSQWRSGGRHLVPFDRTTELTGELPPIALPAGRSEGIPVIGGNGGQLRLSRSGDRLEVAFVLDRNLQTVRRLSLLAFGYRRDLPFARLPKIEVRVGAKTVQVFDQGQAVKSHGVSVERRADRVVLGLPLALLGTPERLLLSAGTLSEAGAFVRLPWRVVELGGG